MVTKTNNRMIDGAAANVLDFGAVGDGVTDDTAAIQAALNAGTTIDVGAGTFLLSSTVSIPENATIIGTRNLTVFKRASGFTGTMLVVRSNNTIKDCTFDGAAVMAGNGNSLGIDTKANVTLIRCAFQNSPNDGVLCTDTARITIRDCVTFNNYRNGMSFTDTVENVSIIGMRCTDDAVAGVDFEPNTTVSSVLRVSDVVLSGTTLSIQGGGSVNYNAFITINNIHVLGGSTFNVNRGEKILIDNVLVSEDSDITIGEQGTSIYGQTNGSFTNCYGKFLNVGYSRVLNGDFQNGDTNWAIVRTGGADTVEVVDNRGLYGTFEAHCANDVAGNVAFYVSDQFPVVANQKVTFGGVIRPIVGRPYMLLQIRQGTTVLSEHRLANNFYTPDFNIPKNYFATIQVPATADNARVYIGAGNGELSEGYFDGIFAHVDCIKTTI